MSKKYEKEIADIQKQIEELQKSVRTVTTPEGLIELEKEIKTLVDALGNALLGQKVQEAIDSPEMSETEAGLIAEHPQRFKREQKIER